jgi:hypothetical protein
LVECIENTPACQPQPYPSDFHSMQTLPDGYSTNSRPTPCPPPCPPPYQPPCPPPAVELPNGWSEQHSADQEDCGIQSMPLIETMPTPPHDLIDQSLDLPAPNRNLGRSNPVIQPMVWQQTSERNGGHQPSLVPSPENQSKSALWKSSPRDTSRKSGLRPIRLPH